MEDLIPRAAAIEAIKPLLYSGNCVSALINIPTLYAIPVAWLEAHSREYYEDWGEEPVTVENALAIWQKEQEAKKPWNV